MHCTQRNAHDKYACRPYVAHLRKDAHFADILGTRTGRIAKFKGARNDAKVTAAAQVPRVSPSVSETPKRDIIHETSSPCKMAW
mmetsp:Transcript_19185/g.27005  ORF Transcript_19185/g.27005 Transcript_19185/m.27005 type:complete len:84 (-) Transcript_19185:722-973(-)